AEFAGNASVSSLDPSHPASPLNVSASADWVADTGATSHMSPHCYRPISVGAEMELDALSSREILFHIGSDVTSRCL
ncbi:hypothetical protein SISNIDRAFT_418769, partial [Sistotremastrum niveocremeum HHB9708]